MNNKKSLPKYKASALSLLISFPLLVTGCNPKNLPLIGKLFGGDGSGSGTEVNLVVWGLWETESTMQPLFQRYMEAHPKVKISYEERSIMPLVDYKERVFTRAFEENDKPDVVMVHASWVPKLISGNGLWAAPSGLVSTDYVGTNFFPVVKDVGVVGGSVYSLPSTYDGLVLVYNRAHFEEAGIVKPPTDWEEFRRDAITLTVRSDKELIRGGAVMGTANNNEHFSDILGLMWVQAGVTIPEGIDTDQAEDALTFYTNFSKEDGVWNSDMPESVAAFVGGKASMMIVPTWRLYEVLSTIYDPSIVGVSQVPQALEEFPASWATYWTWVVLKSSPNSNESWDVVNYLTEDAQQTSLFSEVLKIRQFGSIYSNTVLAQNLVSNSYLRSAIETAPYAKTAEIAGRAGNRRQYDALKKAVNDVLEDISVSTALSTAKTDITK